MKNTYLILRLKEVENLLYNLEIEKLSSEERRILFQAIKILKNLQAFLDNGD